MNERKILEAILQKKFHGNISLKNNYELIENTSTEK